MNHYYVHDFKRGLIACIYASSLIEALEIADRNFPDDDWLVGQYAW